MPTATKSKPTLRDFVSKLLELIARGKLDNHLETIMAECNARRRVVRDQTMRKNVLLLGEPGTKVRVTGPIKPRYFLGAKGTVVERPEGWTKTPKPGTLFVDFGRMFGRGGRTRYGPVVNIPASCLEETI